MTTSTRGKARGPYAKTAERRRDIGRAVLDLVREKGHGAVTTAEVAERAGAREATVLYHFPSKDHLLVAALAQADEQAVEPYRVAGEPDDLLEALRNFAHIGPQRENELRLYAALAGHATTPGHPAQEYFARHYSSAIAYFAGIVSRRQAAGLADPALDPAEVARQLVATWDGLQAQWLADRSFDIGDLLVSAFRRLSGRDRMEDRDSGRPHRP
ncbi:TetR/AcrR family transcriptional regulator [Nocardia carnea]|uniref:TetR/AcrR family transcriptional regulator n=1 Tax=Nocardia carnea TaxID=37328 RepID=UPI0024585ED6|nr:TetR/AcrR family transcriptional regulator [Nocardia carnea]